MSAQSDRSLGRCLAYEGLKSAGILSDDLAKYLTSRAGVENIYTRAIPLCFSALVILTDVSLF